jgi:hypothetical protein
MNVNRRYIVFTGFWKYFPSRFRRLFFHFIPSRLSKQPSYGESTWWMWPVELLFLIFDLVGIPDYIMQLRLLFNSQIRSINDREIKVITHFFGTPSFLNDIWMSTSDSFRLRKFAHAFVLHNSINFHQSISDSILIHEAMHVLQYHLVGSIYIIRSLMAQRSSEGYGYGGSEAIYHNMLIGKSIWQYNYEQQAQIIQDYYDLSTSTNEAIGLKEIGYKILLNEVRESIAYL